jgi:hypothetical protein
MNITAITTMVLTATAAYGISRDRVGTPKVTVCVELIPTLRLTIGQAQEIASRMFTPAGVTINWRRGSRGCPAQGIEVSIRSRTPESLMPGALAYALPYEGAHVQLFYDRITEAGDSALLSRLLAHVLVHEITHILQRSSRHSTHGIMKARWELEDYVQMRSKPLAFAGEDIDLIRHGLAARATSPMIAGR